ncbi:hypothetical protein LSH36_68g06004, partial [Paralvinella palmiformis]
MSNVYIVNVYLLVLCMSFYLVLLHKYPCHSYSASCNCYQYQVHHLSIQARALHAIDKIIIWGEALLQKSCTTCTTYNFFNQITE